MFAISELYNKEISPIEPFSFEGNLHENWQKWILEFEIFLRDSDLHKATDARKVAQLVSSIGNENKVNKILHLLEVNTEKITYKDLVSKLEYYFDKAKRTTCERYKLFTRKQYPSECIESFVNDLNKIASLCDLGTSKSSLLKDLMIAGLSNESIQIEMLNRAARLQLKNAISLAKELEEKVNGNERKDDLPKCTTDLQKCTKNDQHNSTNFEDSFLASGPSTSIRATESAHLGLDESLLIHSESNTNSEDSSSEDEMKQVTHSEKYFQPKSDRREEKMISIKYSTEKHTPTPNTSKSAFKSTDISINGNIIKCSKEIKIRRNIMCYSTYTLIKQKESIIKTNIESVNYGDIIIPVIGVCYFKCKFENDSEGSVPFFIREQYCRTVLGWRTCKEFNLIS